MTQYESLNLTSYEALDLAQSAFSNALAAYAILLSVAFGYLVAGYLVGPSLSRLQVRLVSFLFSVVMAVLIWSMSAYVYWGDVFSTIARGDFIARFPMAPQPWLPALLAAINILTAAACLFFMWNVRRSESTSSG